MPRDLIYQIIDFPFRLRNAIRRRIKHIQLFSTLEDKSDSQSAFYESAVSKIVTNERAFTRFRRIYDYREILEHVNFRLGGKYLEIVKEREPNSLSIIKELRKNDQLGRPRQFSYDKIGKISPTTLRYLAVATDLRSHFGKDHEFEIGEIGGGYGGQALVLAKLGWVKSYSVFDLPSVQILISKYLSLNNIENVHFPSLDFQNLPSYDLVISNYAFSELPRQIQEEYLVKVILKSRRGYMLMNSGLRNETGRSNGKITLNELEALIPNLQVTNEKPLTSPDNYLVTWNNC
jgi:putative sugar O-methyltransferase